MLSGRQKSWRRPSESGAGLRNVVLGLTARFHRHIHRNKQLQLRVGGGSTSHLRDPRAESHPRQPEQQCHQPPGHGPRGPLPAPLDTAGQQRSTVDLVSADGSNTPAPAAAGAAAARRCSGAPTELTSAASAVAQPSQSGATGQPPEHDALLSAGESCASAAAASEAASASPQCPSAAPAAAPPPQGSAAAGAGRPRGLLRPRQAPSPGTNASPPVRQTPSAPPAGPSAHAATPSTDAAHVHGPEVWPTHAAPQPPQLPADAARGGRRSSWLLLPGHEDDGLAVDPDQKLDYWLGDVESDTGPPPGTYKPLVYCIHQPDPLGPAVVYEVPDLGVDDMATHVWQALQREPLVELPAGALSFTLCEHRTADGWHAYHVHVPPEYDHDPRRTLHPLRLLCGERVMHNARHRGDLLRFMADPTRGGVQAHLAHIALLPRASRRRGRKRTDSADGGGDYRTEGLAPYKCHELLQRRYGERGLAHVGWGRGDTLTWVQAVRADPRGAMNSIWAGGWGHEAECG